ncbi:outer membrane protein [Herminiimonas sp. NPDC097707]|uniref:outer membrane protein n=1 Tax=Herminiimonas sp. NPDC097707 TaxID=3364007 RepID=UPI00383AA63B
MKQILITLVSVVFSASVVAADSDSLTQRPVAPVAMANWAGVYIGVNGGMAQSTGRDVTTTETLNNKFLNRNQYGNLSSDVGFGGVQVGYNWQRNNFVLGVEGDIQSGMSDSTLGRAAIGGGTFYDLATSSKIKWFGTARLRTGYTFNKSLVYVTGGMAVGDTEYTQNFSDNVDYSANFSKSKTRIGYVLGAGMEHAMTKNSSIKLEYQYLDFGRVNLDVPESGPVSGYVLHTGLRSNFQIVRLGVNWKY